MKSLHAVSVILSPRYALIFLLPLLWLTACSRSRPEASVFLKIGDETVPLHHLGHVQSFQREILDLVTAHWAITEGDVSVWYQVVSHNAGGAEAAKAHLDLETDLSMGFVSEVYTSPFRLQRVDGGGIQVERLEDSGDITSLGKSSAESPMLVEALLKSPLNTSILHAILTHAARAKRPQESGETISIRSTSTISQEPAPVSVRVVEVAQI